MTLFELVNTVREHSKNVVSVELGDDRRIEVYNPVEIHGVKYTMEYQIQDFQNETPLVIRGNGRVVFMAYSSNMAESMLDCPEVARDYQPGWLADMQVTSW